MQLRLFRHFVPVSVVLLASSDALLITGAFYQLISSSEVSIPIVLGVSSFSAQFSAGLSVATVTAMLSVGLYGQQSFMDFRLLFSKIVVASVLVLMLVSFSATYWRDGLDQLTDFVNFPLKATLIWLVCVSVTRGTFSVTLGRGLLKRRVLVLGSGTQADRIAKLVETGHNDHFIPVSFVDVPDRTTRSRAETLDWSATETDGLLEMGYRLAASEIVVAADDRRGLPVRELLHCKLAGIKVTDFLDFWERETRTVDLEALKPSWFFYSDGFRCGPVRRVFKTCLRHRGELEFTGADNAAVSADGLFDQVGESWAGPLPSRKGGIARSRFYDSEISQHAAGCRDRRPSSLGCEV
jgi:hypothetical protein